LEDYTSPCGKHYCFYHYRTGYNQLHEVINLNVNPNRSRGSKVQDVQELTLCVELDFCLASYCSAMLKQVYHCSRLSAAFLRHGIADASIALLIWLKRNLQDEKALTLYFRKKGIQTGALCLYLITLRFLLQEPLLRDGVDAHDARHVHGAHHARDGDDAHALHNPRASLTEHDERV